MHSLLRQLRRPAFTRSILHVPALASFLASAALKKLAFHKLLHRLGTERVFRGLREANTRLHQTQPGLHSAEAYERTQQLLEQAEAGLQGLREHERTAKAWAWFDALDQNNSIAAAVLKTYFEGLSPVKWASALRGSSPPPKRPDAADGSAPAAAGVEQRSPWVTKEAEALERRLRELEPQLQRYHLILVPKEESGAEVKGSVGQER